MSKVPINWISTYLYCKRKLYLEETRKLRTISKDHKFKEELRQKIFDKINFKDKDIVKSIKNFKKLEEIQMIFREEYYNIIQQIIREESERFLENNVNKKDFFHNIWPDLLNEANLRSKNVFDLMISEKVYSNELWNKLFPKYLSEVKLENDKITGRIDRIEIYPNHVVPIEIKKGKAPKFGVWLGDKSQIEIYMDLSEKEFGKKVNHGFVNYLESEEIRSIPKNLFINEYTDVLLEDIKKTLKGPLPDFVKNRKKCINCPLKDRCYSLKE